MASCGIKKYDDLPARVGNINVDACRKALKNNMLKQDTLKNKYDALILVLDSALRYFSYLPKFKDDMGDK